MNETDVRKWLRRVMGSDVQWVEPGRGSSVGVADAVIPVGGYQLPLELKFWHRTSKGLRCDIRPAQRRYHILSAKKGLKTAFLVGECTPAGLELWAFPGHLCPVEPYPNDLSMCHVYSSGGVQTKEEFVSLLSSDKFWEL